jgi:hypothetical protein
MIPKTIQYIREMIPWMMKIGHAVLGAYRELSPKTIPYIRKTIP